TVTTPCNPLLARLVPNGFGAVAFGIQPPIRLTSRAGGGALRERSCDGRRSLAKPRAARRELAARARSPAWAHAMRLRATGARRRGNSPRRTEEGTGTAGPEAGRERRLMYGHLGAPARAAVNRERRAPAAGSRAFIQDAGRRFAAIPHSRPGHA